MELTCTQADLSRGLAVVQHAVSTRTTLPITQYVLLATDEGRLKLTTTNLSVSISTWVPATVYEDGAITVRAQMLTEYVASLGKQELRLSTEKGRTVMHAQTSTSASEFFGVDAKEFPPVARVGEGITTAIDAPTLKKAIGLVGFATAAHEGNTALTGVNLAMDGSRITLAAADGFRLAEYGADLAEPVAEPLSVIVPSKAIREVGKLIETEELVHLAFNKARSQLLFRLNNTEFVTALLGVRFPPYRQVIPTEYFTRAVAPASEWTRAIKTAALFDGGVVVDMEPGQDEVPGSVAVAPAHSAEGTAWCGMAAAVEGTGGRIAYTARYMLDVLETMGDGRAALEIREPALPCVVRMIDDEQYIYVVMPLLVTDPPAKR